MSRNLQFCLIVAFGLVALSVGLKVGTSMRDTPGAGENHAAGTSVANTPETLVPFTLSDVNGDEISSSRWAEKPLLINFWATWCAPCREEIPLLNDAAARYADKGLVVAGVAIDDLETVRRFGDEIGIVYPSLIAGRDLGYDMLETYNPPAQLPFSLMVAPGGKIIAHKLGLLSPEEIAAWVSAAADH